MCRFTHTCLCELSNVTQCHVCVCCTVTLLNLTSFIYNFYKQLIVRLYLPVTVLCEWNVTKTNSCVHLNVIILVFLYIIILVLHLKVVWCIWWWICFLCLSLLWYGFFEGKGVFALRMAWKWHGCVSNGWGGFSFDFCMNWNSAYRDRQY